MKIVIQFLIYLSVYISILSGESYEFAQRYNARAIGMGNIFCPVADDSTAIFYNPAGLCQIEKTVFNSMYADIHSLGIVKNFILSAADKYNDDFCMAGAWVYERIDLEPEVWQQHRFFYGISYTVLERLYIGITPKVIFIDTDLKNYEKIWGYAFDAGFLVTSENWGIGFFDNNEMILSIGINFKNIYSEIKWSENYKEHRFLNLIWWGINMNYKKSLSFLLQIKSMKTSLTTISIGLEFFLFNAFGIQLDDKYKINDIILRCGMEYNRDIIIQRAYTTGIGVIANNYSFNYAISYQADYFSPTHYFSLSARN